MEQNNLNLIKKIMEEFGSITGLNPASENPKRYLWTDSFAVCNYLELYNQTNNQEYLNLALKLVDQVHHTLGKHRKDDSRKGWISGLDDEKAQEHPTIGGLRIGKKLNERMSNEPPDEALEWEQDGQYFHYLTKWMHALNKVSQVTGDVKYLQWAIELAKTAHQKFTYLPAKRQRKIMYWKMSIDLTRPLVLSMGQHDPLDGFVTYNELILTSKKDFNTYNMPELKNEISEMADICRGMNLVTTDTLGIGGLLFDAGRVIQLNTKEDSKFNKLTELILDSALMGMSSFTRNNPLKIHPEYRLAFRELGLSIGFKSIKNIQRSLNQNLNKDDYISKLIKTILNYESLVDKIEKFWIDDKNHQYRSWIEHQEINMVMLATALAPDEFINI